MNENQRALSVLYKERDVSIASIDSLSNRLSELDTAIKTLKARSSYDGFMDSECIEICDALNEMSGVRTFESCCGHGEHPFQIHFSVESLEALGALLQRLPEDSPWIIRVGWASGSKSLYFSLIGSVGVLLQGDDMAKELRKEQPQ